MEATWLIWELSILNVFDLLNIIPPSLPTDFGDPIGVCYTGNSRPNVSADVYRAIAKEFCLLSIDLFLYIFSLMINQSISYISPLIRCPKYVSWRLDRWHHLLVPIDSVQNLHVSNSVDLGNAWYSPLEVHFEFHSIDTFFLECYCSTSCRPREAWRTASSAPFVFYYQGLGHVWETDSVYWKKFQAGFTSSNRNC